MIKNKKVIIIFLVVILLIIICFLFRRNNKVERYVISLGFKKVDNLYEKKLSGMDLEKYHSLVEQNVPTDSTYLYFDLDRSLLTEVGLKYSLDLQYSFFGSYDFKNDILSYHYDVNSGVISAMVKGEYLNDSESCSCESVYLKNAEESDDEIFSLICEQAQYSCLDFYFHSKTLIANPFIMDELKK